MKVRGRERRCISRKEGEGGREESCGIKKKGGLREKGIKSGSKGGRRRMEGGRKLLMKVRGEGGTDGRN